MEARKKRNKKIEFCSDCEKKNTVIDECQIDIPIENIFPPFSLIIFSSSVPFTPFYV